MTVPVTIVIPTLDGGDLFGRALQAIGGLDPAPEQVLVLDSGSRDGSERRAKEIGARVEAVAPGQFDHGKTRQRGVELATTELVAFLSQDAIPCRDYLGPLVEALSDPAIVGATARILPYAESSPLARRTVLASPLAGEQPRIVRLAPGELDRLPGAERRRLCLFDNVASLARRSFLLEQPFPATMMGEDTAFALAALALGHGLAFVPGAVVHHAHEYGPVSAFRRYREDARWARRQFGDVIRGRFRDLLRGFAFEVREDLRALGGLPPGERLATLVRSPFVRAGQVLGQFAGSRGAVGGKAAMDEVSR